MKKAEEASTQTKKTELFETVPIRKAAMTLVIPTVISQLVVVIYNMADTWYIGQTGDPYQVAAVTVTYPIFMLLTAVANLFGIGGSSLISRMLGSGEQRKTGNVAAFSLWTAGGVALLYALICLLFDRQLLTVLGTESGTLAYAQNYLFWTVVIGGLPTVLNLVLANIIRAQGEARTASIGMSLGGFLNVVLDPIFIFLMGMGVAGAALATCLSNTIALAYLLLYTVRHRKESLVEIPLFPQWIGKKAHRDIYAIGTPAALQIVLAAVSNAVLVTLMSGYAVAAVSGMGVMQKVESIPFQAIMGISNGILPLGAYNFASGNRARMHEAVRFALRSGIFCACACFLLCEAFTPTIVRFFIADSQSVAYGASFVRLRILALPFITVEFMLIAVFQGIGGARQAFFLSLFRKGILDLPLMMLFNLLWSMYGLMLVQPFMELTGSLIALAMYKNIRKGSAVPRMVAAPQNITNRINPRRK